MNSKIIMIFIVFFIVQNSHAGKVTLPLELLALFCTKFECETEEGNHAMNEALINGKDGDELNVPVGIDNKDGAGESTNANKTHEKFTLYDILFPKKNDPSTESDSETRKPTDIRYRYFTNTEHEEVEGKKTDTGQAALFSVSGNKITQIFINPPKAKAKYKDIDDESIDSSVFINDLDGLIEMTLDRECTIEKTDKEKSEHPARKVSEGKIYSEKKKEPEIPEIPSE